MSRDCENFALDLFGLIQSNMAYEPAVIDESIVTDVIGTVDDENGAGDVFVDEFDAAAADCDGGADVVAAWAKLRLQLNFNQTVCAYEGKQKGKHWCRVDILPVCAYYLVSSFADPARFCQKM